MSAGEANTTQTLAAYNVLRANVTEAAKLSQSMFWVHMAVQGYACLTLLGMKDNSFFELGNQLRLPLLETTVPPALFLPFIALLSLLVFAYWQAYQRKMWLLAQQACHASTVHALDENFVPADGAYRHPWIAFFVDDEDNVLRWASGAYSLVQWTSMPLVQVMCWMRAFRLRGAPWQWPMGLPWAPFFGLLFALGIFCCWLFWLTEPRSDTSRTRTFPRLSRVVGATVRVNRLRGVVPLAVSVLVLPSSALIARLHPLQLLHLRAQGRDFDHFNMKHAILWGAHLQGAHFLGAHVENANFGHAHLEQTNFALCHLERALFWQTSMMGAYFPDAHLEYASFVNTDARSAHFEGAHLEGTTFVNTNLGNAHLEGAHLKQVTLTNVDLSGAFLSGAHLQGANLEFATLSNAKLLGARYDANTIFPSGFDAASYDMIQEPRP